MSRAIRRIKKGFTGIVDFHSRNVVKGIRKLIMSGKNIEQAVTELIVDGLEDIDRRLNKLPEQEFAEDVEDENDSENNILIDYCYGEIYGPNYGIRTLLEYEEECEEGVNCSEDIDPNDGTKTTEESLASVDESVDNDDSFFAKKGMY